MKISVFTFLLIAATACHAQTDKPKTDATLPAPYETKSVKNFSHVIGWKDGSMPKAPAGFAVSKYADGFNNPRWLYVAPNGDILVAESNSNHSAVEKVGGVIIGANRSNNLDNSASIITLLRDTNKDGFPDVREILLTAEQGLDQPFGMLIIGQWLYVANTQAILRYPYKAGQTRITEMGQKIVDLPGGGRHWTKNIITNADSSKIYI